MPKIVASTNNAGAYILYIELACFDLLFLEVPAVKKNDWQQRIA
jgi:hypothetical protein